MAVVYEKSPFALLATDSAKPCLTFSDAFILIGRYLVLPKEVLVEFWPGNLV